MSNYNISLQLIARNSMYGICPLMLRESSFRFLMLGSVYLTTDIEHRPVLKYSVQQIVEFMKIRREMGYDDSLQDLQDIFYEYHNYNVRTNYTARFLMLIIINLMATLVTNPIDVCLTKILT